MAAIKVANQARKLADEAARTAAQRLRQVTTTATFVVDKFGPDVFLETFTDDTTPDIVTDFFQSLIDEYNEAAKAHSTPKKAASHTPRLPFAKFLKAKGLDSISSLDFAWPDDHVLDDSDDDKEEEQVEEEKEPEVEKRKVKARAKPAKV